jgi:hypothetical protein
MAASMVSEGILRRPLRKIAMLKPAICQPVKIGRIIVVPEEFLISIA